MKIGFIGVGAMGKPMAKNLLSAGYEVYVHDLSEANVKELGSLGAKVCAGGGELAAKADLIITSLPNAKIVETVMTGQGGVLESCQPGAIIMDMSSVAPASTKAMAKAAERYGVVYMDAPVSGGVAGAAAGTLTIMVGCDEATYEKVSDVLRVLGKNIYHVGEAGAGDAIKIVNNLLLGVSMAALAEALVLGVRLGLRAETMKEVIGVSSGRSYALEAKFDQFIMADAFDKGFAVDLQRKDLGLALDAAKDVAAPLPLTAAAAQVFEMARAKGFNRQDISAVVKVWEDLAGIKIKNS
ncbi:MAG: NAD(P)-dependent oxidoreductase [Peptococcaceae bacterium]|jgi:2-hydroxymethylglutarate dehydrogenase|nr:NAD(P)-dependent oxidoreductase [Peptococcaceae bacterium]